ncbi:MAG: hypothetical protein R3D71_04475 [Rickettsiales bacterium]
MFDPHNPLFWISLAFIAFVVLIYKKVSSLLFKALDDRSAKIKKELEDAKRLRLEAEETLALYKQKQEDFTKEAEEILAKARIDAEVATDKAQKELREHLDARLKSALEKIEQEEKQAIDEVKNRIVDIALGSARIVIASNPTELSRDGLVDMIVSDIEKKIH